MIEPAIDPRSLKLLEKGMEKATRIMHPAKAVNKAGTQICRSAGAAMKVKASTKRDIIENPDRTGRGRRAKGAKYLIVVKHQDKQDSYIPTNEKNDRRRRIARLNLARSTFLVSQRKFSRSRTPATVRGASKFQRVVQTYSRFSYTARIENRLSYLLDVFPEAIDKAIVKGMTAFIRQFDRDWASAL